MMFFFQRSCAFCSKLSHTGASLFLEQPALITGVQGKRAAHTPRFDTAKASKARAPAHVRDGSVRWRIRGRCYALFPPSQLLKSHQKFCSHLFLQQQRQCPRSEKGSRLPVITKIILTCPCSKCLGVSENCRSSFYHLPLACDWQMVRLGRPEMLGLAYKLQVSLTRMYVLSMDVTQCTKATRDN